MRNERKLEFLSLRLDGTQISLNSNCETHLKPPLLKTNKMLQIENLPMGFKEKEFNYV